MKKVSGGVTTDYHYVEGELVAETRSDGKSLTYLYDTAGNKTGFVYNGDFYFYDFNLQGDVIAIRVRIGGTSGSNMPEVIARYTYDAWGRVLSVTDGAGNPVADPNHIANVNPIRYRGYYYDAETGFYSLQSRYYDPEIGRFISPEPNVDFGGFDEGAGLLAHNVYAYCANNPVIYKDETGESLTLAIFGVTLGVKGIIALAGMITISSVALAYVADPNFRRAWDQMCISAVGALGSGMSSAINWASSKAKSIAKSIGDSFARTRTKPNYRSPREVHHIVAQQAPNAWLARDILNKVGLGYNSPYNLVSLKTGLHRRLHTNEYYGWANSVIISAYNSANGNKARQRSNVINALNSIRGYLLAIDAVSPF